LSSQATTKNELKTTDLDSVTVNPWHDPPIFDEAVASAGKKITVVGRS
jgi:hypothetical protein